MPNKQLPDNVHELKGSYNKTAHGDKKKKPKVKDSNMKPPSWLDSLAKKEWSRVLGLLESHKVITGVDEAVFANYCDMYSKLQQDSENFSAAMRTQLRMSAIELGLTPSARSKIIVPEDGSDDFDAI